MKTSRSAIILLGTISLALVCGWALLVYLSYSYKADIAEASAADRERVSESSYLASLRALMREEEADIQAIEERFIQEEDIPLFVESLEDKASQSGVEATLGSLNLGNAAEGSAIAPLSVSIAAKGPWQSLVRFVSALDYLPYASKIEGVSFSKIESSAPEAQGAWNARIDFIQYVEKSKE